MKYLLEEGIVDGVVGVTQGHDIYDVPTLIIDPADVIKPQVPFTVLPKHY